MRRSALFVLLLFIGCSLAIATASGCGQIEQALGLSSPSLSPSGTGTGTPTPSLTPTAGATMTPLAVTTSGYVTTFDWGSVSLPAGSSPIFSLNVPAGAISIDFMALGAAADAANYFAFFDMIAPGPRTVIDNTGAGPTRQGYNNGAMSFTVPADDSSTSAVASGTWTFGVAAFGPNPPNPVVASNPHVMAIVRTDPAAPTVPNGVIEVRFFFPPCAAPNYTATLAQQPGEIQTALSTTQTLYGSQGLSLDLANAQYIDLADTQQACPFGGSVADENALQKLFMESSAYPPFRGVNVFFVSGFSGNLSGAAGIAGGIPIPMDVTGTQHSGVAVAPQGVANAKDTGEDIAHEMGHSLGLYHTTEIPAAPATTPTTYDPISDTPQCTNLGQGGANASSCPDRTDVMFPILNGQFTGFTAGQAKVIKPVVNVKTVGTFAGPPPGPRVVFDRPNWPLGPITPASSRPPGLVITCRLPAPRIGPNGAIQP